MEPEPVGNRDRHGRQVTGLAVLLVLLGSLAYANAFSPTFVGADAKESIRDNPHIRSLWPPHEAMSLSLLAETIEADADSKGGTLARRPFLSLSFAVSRALHGPDPWGFQLNNILIHLGAGLLLFGVLRRTLARLEGFDAPTSIGLAWGAATAWLLHPVHAEAVTYVVQRAESQAGFLMLLALYCAIRGFAGARTWWGLSVAASALGMGTKESVVVLPLAILLYDYIFVSPSARTALHRHRLLYAGLAGSWLILFALLAWTASDVGRDFGEGRTWSYLAAQPGAILHYLRVALWPDELALFISTETFDFAGFGAFLWRATLVVALFVAAAAAAVARRPVGFPSFLFFLLLAPTSTIVATSDVVQEHRLYLPLASIYSGLAVALYRGISAAFPPRASIAVAVTVTLVIIGGLGLRTHERNYDFHDEFSAVAPSDRHEAYMILAQHYLNRDAYDDARAWALALLSDDRHTPEERTFGHFLLGVVAERTDDLESATTHLLKAVERDPTFAYGHRELATVLQRDGRLAEGRAAAERAIVLRPAFPEAHVELGMILMQQGASDRALAHFRKALELWPRFADAHFELGLALADRADWRAAREHLEAAVDIRPDFDEARERLQEVREELAGSS